MSGNDPHKLDYADPELPRSSEPPDGYLGYRSTEPPPGIRIGCFGWIIILLMALAIVWVALWMISRKLASHGI